MPPPKCHSEKGYICNCDRYSMKLELSSMFITHRLSVMHASVNFHKYIPYGLGVMARTQIGTYLCTYGTDGHLMPFYGPHTVYYMELSQGQIIQKPNKQELSSFFTPHCLNVMHAPVNFHKYIRYGLGVMARTRFTLYGTKSGADNSKTKQARMVFLLHDTSSQCHACTCKVS